MPEPLVPWLLGLLLCLVAVRDVGSGSASRHPQDGPDVDVRVRIEERKVVVQAIFNLAYLDEILDVPREDETALHPVEYPSVHHALFAYLKESNQVRIDGVVVTPVDAGFDVDPGDLSLLPLFPLSGTRALIKARIVLEYPAKSSPKRVALSWGEYPPDLVLAGPDGVAPPIEILAQLEAEGDVTTITLRKDEPEYVWHATPGGAKERFLSVPAPPPEPTWNVPLVSLGLGGAWLLALCVGVVRGAGRSRRLWGALPLVAIVAFLLRDAGARTIPAPFGGGADLPTEAEALAAFAPLHANIYRAFDYSDESDVYDALARSVEGDLLDDLYDEVYRSLILQEEGGAVCRVQEVRTLAAEVASIGFLDPDDRVGFRVKTRWQVDGSVYHWGHTHDRTNEHLAEYTVVQGDEGWRIRGSQTLEQFVVEATPR